MSGLPQRQYYTVKGIRWHTSGTDNGFSLYPDIHPNQPGRYRIFKDVRIGENREKVLLMAEFRLED